MLKDPTGIKLDDIRALVYPEIDPIQPLHDASAAYFADVDERAMQNDTLLDREDVPGDPRLYQTVIDAWKRLKSSQAFTENTWTELSGR